jgi:RNA polymerase sigma-70 factor (ECF subfamily)
MNAFRESVEAMIPALRRYARALTRDTDVTDDLV